MSVIQIVTKFTEGGWGVAVLIPVQIALLKAINVYYRRFAIDVAFRGRRPLLPHKHTVVVALGDMNKASAAALIYATSFGRAVTPVHVDVDPEHTARFQREWDRWDIGYELEILPSPYRCVIRPLVDYVCLLQEQTPDLLVTVVTPTLVPTRWWEHLLHNKTVGEFVAVPVAEPRH